MSEPKFLKNPEGRIFESTPELLAAARKHKLMPCESPEEITAKATPLQSEADNGEREALAAEFFEKFGKKPHGKWTAEKIREELAKDAD